MFHAYQTWQLSRLPSSAEFPHRGLDGCEQGARFTGLRQVADNAIAQRANSIAVVGKSRDQDGWNGMTRLQKTVMQLEPGHAGHMDISDQAAGSADIGLRQEFGRGSESDNGVPPGPHEAGQSLTHILIVVDNRDQGLCTQSDLLPGHNISTVMAVQTLRERTGRLDLRCGNTRRPDRLLFLAGNVMICTGAALQAALPVLTRA
jgi:hypothetical protein